MGAGLGIFDLLFAADLFGVNEVRIEMTRSEEDALAVGRKEAARRLAAPGADPPRLTASERLGVDLIEWIVLRHRLIDNRPAVGREVSFAGPDETARHLADVREIARFDRQFF